MVHHRIWSKRRNKLKFVDPFNRTPHQRLEKKQRSKNIEPTNADEQPITRRQRELFENAETAVSLERTFPRRRRKTRDFVLAEVIKGEFEIHDVHNRTKMLRQVYSQTNKEIKEQQLLAKFGLAGRDQAEIAADYAKMDMRQQQRQLRKKKLKETLENKNSKQKRELQNKCALVSSARNRNVDQQNEEGLKNLSKKMRKVQKRQEEEISDEKEMLLNAREIIPFGCRVDAPPTFSAFDGLRTQKFMRPGMKQLLLKESVASNEQVSSSFSNNSRKIGKTTAGEIKRDAFLAAERQKVIEAYRNLKKVKKKSL